MKQITQIYLLRLAQLATATIILIALVLQPFVTSQFVDTILAATNPPTAQSGINLKVESFSLTDSTGKVKTSFKAGEKIYVKSVISNVGTKSAPSGTKTQYFKNKPSLLAVGSKDSPEMATSHGTFTVSKFTYESRPGGSRATQFTIAYFSQSTAGTYTARVFTDANNLVGETNESDNQKTLTYTITGSATPTATPKPSPTPTPAIWPKPVTNPMSYDMIVNKKFILDASFVPSDLVYPAIANPKNHQLRKAAATALKTMADAAKSQSNITFRVASGYRSYQTQYDLYWGYVATNGQAKADTFSARPGHSEHQTGLTLDIGDAAATQCDVQNCFKDTAGGKWVAANGHKYGFIIRYPLGKESITGYKYEPWHIRYVGVDLATKIKASGKVMEEYFNVPGGNYQ